jgi:cobalt-precorrin 5A hydrolase/precorrin-3B C17-methyltransferase
VAPVIVSIVAATEAGRRHAEHLATALDGTVVEGRPAAAVAGAWPRSDWLVLCMAAGAAVRLIAPHLTSKHEDPAVVCVDDAGTFAVALSGAHHGGNVLAGMVADALGAEPVVTTASDVLGFTALDHLGAGLGLRLDPATRGAVAAVSGRLMAGEPVALHRTRPWPTGPLPGNVTDASAPAAPGIVVGDETTDVPAGCLVYRPRSLVVGVGASRGVTAGEVASLVDQALAGAGLSPLSVARLATVDLKADEAGIVEAAEARGWPLVAHPAARLAGIEVPNPSEVVRAEIGIPSVAEAAALADGGELLVAKRKSAMATVAVARLPVSGRLALVSTGPGAEELVTPAAVAALAGAELVVGLDQYVERVRRWLRPGTEVAASPIGDEVARAELAVDEAVAGRSVVLLSGGDVGVYAMASPALERAPAGLDVVVVPGVTAANAAAALLGSPLGHDHCSISLSDLLTPWEVIQRRVRAAADGDFVVSFYNPRSRGRDWQLGEAVKLLLERREPSTPVGIVTDASRPAQQVELTTLGELDPASVGMLSIVVAGNSQTAMLGGRMVTPRGYAL